MAEQWWPGADRGGWSYAMQALERLHHPDGVRFDGWLDKKFSWGTSNGDCHYNPMAYGEPWVGVIHMAPGTPEAFRLGNPILAEVLASAQWRDSLPACRGLFTLARRTRDWLAERVPVPVSALRLPVASMGVGWSMQRYQAAQRVVQVGWWLRRFQSFYELWVPGLRKELLGASSGTAHGVHEAQRQQVEKRCWPSVTILPHLSHVEYDEVLASSVVFLDLHDAGGSNAIVECIARNTPMLVNPLPAVVEYLGASYPLYFGNLREAAAKALNPESIERAHEHLKRLPKGWLTARVFLRSIVTSDVYRSLPDPTRPEPVSGVVAEPEPPPPPPPSPRLYPQLVPGLACCVCGGGVELRGGKIEDGAMYWCHGCDGPRTPAHVVSISAQLGRRSSRR